MTPAACDVELKSRAFHERRPRSRGISRTPEAVSDVGATPANTSANNRRNTPGPRISSVGARRESSLGLGGRGSSVGPRRLEDELVKLVLMRMQVTSDVDKKARLQQLAQQLQDATRAARQQLKASRRTEHVLRDCVDPALAGRILEAQHNVTAQTQDAMRACLEATMEALEEECDAKGQLQTAAGMGELRVGNSNGTLSAALAEIRAGVEGALEDLAMHKDLTEIASSHPGAANAIPAGEHQKLERRMPGAASVGAKGQGCLRGEGGRSETPESRGKSVAWQQFLQRQADAARQKLQRRWNGIRD